MKNIYYKIKRGDRGKEFSLRLLSGTVPINLENKQVYVRFQKSSLTSLVPATIQDAVNGLIKFNSDVDFIDFTGIIRTDVLIIDNGKNSYLPVDGYIFIDVIDF